MPFTRSLAAKGKGDDVAIGGEARRRAGRTGRARARASGAGSRSSRACRRRAPRSWHRRSSRFASLASDGAKWIRQPPSRLGDVADGELGEDLGAMRLGVGEIGHRHGVLGADIAARAAIAAQRAGGLRHAGGIDGLLEAHHHGCRDRRHCRSAALAASSARYLVSSRARSRSGWGAAWTLPARSPARAARRRGARSARPGRRTRGRRASSATPALISEPPPSPQPTSTWISVPSLKSNRPVRRAASASCRRSIAARGEAQAGGWETPRSRNSLPFSMTQTLWPARASREAATPPP